MPASSSRRVPRSHFPHFYHSDHLQSTNYVTDALGNLVQHNEYFPHGEVLHEESRINTVRLPYLFNAKELDESKLYYFSARHYDPRSAQWQSPDPILANYMQGNFSGGVFKTGNLGLYSYALNNPIVVRDPTGLHGVEGSEGAPKGGQDAQNVTYVTDWSSLKEYGKAQLESAKETACAILMCMEPQDFGYPGPPPEPIRRMMSTWSPEGNESGSSDTTASPTPPGGDASSAVPLVVTKQERLRQLFKTDPNMSSADRGWIQNEERRLKGTGGGGDKVRSPIGKDLRHPPGRAAAQGFDYAETQLQDRGTHWSQHRYLQERKTGTTIRIPKNPSRFLLKLPR